MGTVCFGNQSFLGGECDSNFLELGNGGLGDFGKKNHRIIHLEAKGF